MQIKHLPNRHPEFVLLPDRRERNCFYTIEYRKAPRGQNWFQERADIGFDQYHASVRTNVFTEFLKGDRKIIKDPLIPLLNRQVIVIDRRVGRVNQQKAPRLKLAQPLILGFWALFR